MQARKNLELVRGTKNVDKEFAAISEAAELAKLCPHPWSVFHRWLWWACMPVQNKSADHLTAESTSKAPHLLRLVKIASMLDIQQHQTTAFSFRLWTCVSCRQWKEDSLCCPALFLLSAPFPCHATRCGLWEGGDLQGNTVFKEVSPPAHPCCLLYYFPAVDRGETLCSPNAFAIIGPMKNHF